jgi:16S rRNA (adenine1518-N6/adenine1519-N6)-dimethyltransferase
MTGRIAHAARAVIAYEIDRDLARLLRETADPNVRVVEGDFLETTAGDIREALQAIGQPDVRPRVAGNLPYNVASPILFKLIDLFRTGVPLADATVMLQREVAERLLALPGTSEYGVLTVLTRYAARAQRLLQLPAGAFRPAPKVLSAVVRLTFHEPDPPVRNLRLFEGLTQAIFTRRRKTLRNAVLAFEHAPAELLWTALKAAGIDLQRRPETLTIAELARFADSLDTLLPPA